MGGSTQEGLFVWHLFCSPNVRSVPSSLFSRGIHSQTEAGAMNGDKHGKQDTPPSAARSKSHATFGNNVMSKLDPCPSMPCCERRRTGWDCCLCAMHSWLCFLRFPVKNPRRHPQTEGLKNQNVCAGGVLSGFPLCLSSSFPLFLFSAFTLFLRFSFLFRSCPAAHSLISLPLMLNMADRESRLWNLVNCV